MQQRYEMATFQYAQAARVNLYVANALHVVARACAKLQQQDDMQWTPPQQTLPYDGLACDVPRILHELRCQGLRASFVHQLVEQRDGLLVVGVIQLAW